MISFFFRHPDRRAAQFAVRSGGTQATNLSSSRIRFLLAAICSLIALFPLRAQNFDKPVTNIDEEVTAFAYAPNGNVVFSVRRMFKTKKYDLQRDDIWLLESGGKRKRLLEGQKFTHDDKLFTYTVESFTW